MAFVISEWRHQVQSGREVSAFPPEDGASIFHCQEHQAVCGHPVQAGGKLQLSSDPEAVWYNLYEKSKYNRVKN